MEGHRRGFDNIEPIIKAARDLGVRHVAVYAFSTENWKRSSEEVAYLMDLFEEMARTFFHRLSKENIAVRFIGQRERLRESLQKVMKEAEDSSPKEPRLTLWVCMSYGGRAEIAEAARQAVANDETELTEETIAKYLWSAGMPDPDLIIRTSGEKRLSNFLLWQSAYSELFFIETHWPAFTPEDLQHVIEEYGERERRLGR